MSQKKFKGRRKGGGFYIKTQGCAEKIQDYISVFQRVLIQKVTNETNVVADRVHLNMSTVISLSGMQKNISYVVGIKSDLKKELFKKFGT